MNFTFPTLSRLHLIPLVLGVFALFAGIIGAAVGPDIQARTTAMFIALIGAGVGASGAVYYFGMPGHWAVATLEREAQSVYGLNLAYHQIRELMPPSRRPVRPEIRGTITILRSGRPVIVHLVFDGERVILADTDGVELTRVVA